MPDKGTAAGRTFTAVLATNCGDITLELFQLTGLPLAWGTRFPPVLLVLGTVFDARDLLVYVATIMLATAVDALLGRASRPR